MEPAQVAAEVLGGDATSLPEEILEAGMAIVDGVDVDVATGALAVRLIEYLMTDAQSDGKRRG